MCTFENFRRSEKESASSVLTRLRVCPHTCDSFLVQGSFHYGGISLTNHTQIFCKQYENALFNHGNALLVSKKSWLEGGEVWRRGAVPLRRWRGEAFQQDSQLAARAVGGRPSIFRLARTNNRTCESTTKVCWGIHFWGLGSNSIQEISFLGSPGKNR